MFLDPLTHRRAIAAATLAAAACLYQAPASAALVPGSFDCRYVENQVRDVPLRTPTAEELAGLEKLRQRSALRTLAPTPEAVAEAYATYDSYNVLVTGDTVSGDLNRPVDLEATRPDAAGKRTINGWMETLVLDGVNGGNAESMQRAANALWQQMQTFTGGNYYDKKTIYKRLAPWIIRYAENPARDFVYRKTYQTLCLGAFWVHPEMQGLNTDALHGLFDIHMTAIPHMFDDAEAVQHLYGFKRFAEQAVSAPIASRDGIHLDGLGYHHSGFHNGYMYAYNTYSGTLHLLHDTPFQVSPAAYERFMAFVRGEWIRRNSACFSTNQMARGGSYSGGCGAIKAGGLRLLGLVGGALGKDGQLNADGDLISVEVAQHYNAIYGDDYAPFAEFGVAPTPQGFWQFNSAPMGIYRNDNWMASIRGYTNELFGMESMPSAVRFNRYIAHGTINIMYEGDPVAMSGFPWEVDIPGQTRKKRGPGNDWTLDPGATSPQLPFLEMIAGGGNAYQKRPFAAALRFDAREDGFLGNEGEIGLFGMDYESEFFNDLGSTFRKSVVSAKGMLLALGTDIMGVRAVPYRTALFQNMLVDETPGEATVNGAGFVGSTGSTSLSAADTQVLKDAVGTGYVVIGDAASADTIEARVGTQTSPFTDVPVDRSIPPNYEMLSGEYATAWIDHGIAPDGASYRYLVVPNATEIGLADLADAMADPATAPLIVRRQDNDAHIVEIPEAGASSVFAYSMFEPDPAITHGPLKAISAPALVMARDSGDRLELSLVNPDLGRGFARMAYPRSPYQTVDVTLRGDWKVASANPDISVLSFAPGEVTFRFSTRHGRALDLELNKAPALSIQMPVLSLSCPQRQPDGQIAFSGTVTPSGEDARDIVMEYGPVIGYGEDHLFADFPLRHRVSDRIVRRGSSKDISALFAELRPARYAFRLSSLGRRERSYSAPVELDIAGGADQVVRFNGVDTYLGHRDSVTTGLASILEQVPEFTIEMRVRAPASQTGAVYGESFSTTTSDRFHTAAFVGDGNGKLRFFYNPGNAPTTDVVSTRTVFDDTWHHLAVVRDAAGTRLYVDGELDETPFDYTPDPTRDFAYTRRSIGATFGRNTRSFFDGEMDEVRIWRVARTPEQLKDNIGARLLDCGNDLVDLLSFDVDDKPWANTAKPGFRYQHGGNFTQAMRADSDGDGFQDAEDPTPGFDDCLVPSLTVTQRCANYLRTLPRDGG